MNKRYFKVMNEYEIHKGHTCRDGLNILQEPINDNSNELLCKRGFSFTVLEHIHKFREHGIYLREVFLPLDDPDFKMTKDPRGYKWMANKIILGQKYPLHDPKTYEYLGLDISYYT